MSAELHHGRVSGTLQTFHMIRNADETGVSGTGRVLDGVVFPNGMVAICWRSETPSMTQFRSFVEFRHVHIDAHPSNNTEICWDPPSTETEAVPEPRPWKDTVPDGIKVSEKS
jgi:hypothetical protein